MAPPFLDRVKRQSQRRSSPTGSLQPGRRCVETSGDVIEEVFTKPKNNCRALSYNPQAFQIFMAVPAALCSKNHSSEFWLGFLWATFHASPFVCIHEIT